MQPTPVLLPGKSHGWRSLVGCSTLGCEESDTTEQIHFHFSLSCIGGGNGNSLQCSCLENPRDGRAWWAAIHGVAQSWTRLKRLSSSSKHHLTEAEDIKKRWQKYTEEQYRKDLNDPDNHNGVIPHLEPDILECEVKWALGSITTKLVKVMGFQLSYFKS